VGVAEELLRAFGLSQFFPEFAAQTPRRKGASLEPGGAAASKAAKKQKKPHHGIAALPLLFLTFSLLFFTICA
jgi:hypothetical protein